MGETVDQERDRYKAALEYIVEHYGKVCSMYEICEHVACASSYGAWATADAALRNVSLNHHSSEAFGGLDE